MSAGPGYEQQLAYMQFAYYEPVEPAQFYPAINNFSQHPAEMHPVRDAYDKPIQMNAMYTIPAQQPQPSYISPYQVPPASQAPYVCMIHWNSPYGCLCNEREEREAATRPLAPAAL